MSRTIDEVSIPNERGRSQIMLGKRRSRKQVRRLPLEAGYKELKITGLKFRMDVSVPAQFTRKRPLNRRALRDLSK